MWVFTFIAAVDICTVNVAKVYVRYQNALCFERPLNPSGFLYLGVLICSDRCQSIDLSSGINLSACQRGGAKREKYRDEERETLREKAEMRRHIMTRRTFSQLHKKVLLIIVINRGFVCVVHAFWS